MWEWNSRDYQEPCMATRGLQNWPRRIIRDCQWWFRATRGHVGLAGKRYVGPLAASLGHIVQQGLLRAATGPSGVSRGHVGSVWITTSHRVGPSGVGGGHVGSAKTAKSRVGPLEANMCHVGSAGLPRAVQGHQGSCRINRGH